MANNRGDTFETLRLATALQAKARAHGWSQELGRSLSLHGSTLLEMGEDARGAVLLEAAVETYDAGSSLPLYFQAKLRLATAWLRLQRLDDAQRAFWSLLDLSRANAYPRGEADALVGLAQVAHSRGELDEALHLYGQARRPELAYPGRDEAPVLLGVARVRLASGDFHGARKLVEQATAFAEDHLLVQTQAFCQACSLLLLASSGEDTAWDATFGRLTHLLRLTRVTTAELVADLRLAAAHARRRGEPAKAEMVEDLLKEHGLGLG